MPELVFLKLGGSLITDKDKPHTPRLDKLAELASEIKTALDSNPALRIVLGHGSGSFGHVPAKKYGTRDGVAPLHLPPNSENLGGVSRRDEGGYWRGFAEVWFQASQLNRIVVESLVGAGLLAISLPPSASIVSDNRQVLRHNVDVMRRALEAGLLPLVQGDVTFDVSLGGTILSTEDVFAFLTGELAPSRILLAGIEAGVWEDFPQRTKLVSRIHSQGGESRAGIGASASTDVTGGMKAKVDEMLALVQKNRGVSVQIFSAEQSGFLTRALQGENVGTLLTA